MCFYVGFLNPVIPTFEYIEVWYNIKRRHSALNYATIEEFNNQINYKNVAKFNKLFFFEYPVLIDQICRNTIKINI